MDISVTYKTTPNIAIVKYWGKRDKVLNLPVNSSLSLTLRDYGLHTITTVRISDQLKSDQLVFNGVEHSLLDDKKIFNVVKRFRDIVRNGTNPRLADYHICVNTQNSFPTAAGMASSASGLACLTKCLSTVYGVLCSQEDEPLLNSITRQASGSACRSLYGGLVHWYKGLRADGLDSIARQIYPSDYWPELRIGICIVSENVKSIGSTEGMNRCVDTSPKMRIRFTDVVDDQIAKAIHAFSVRDFASLGEIIMKESDTLHEICAEAQPPIHYLSKQSHFIIDLVKAINVFMKRIIIAYSFDAGSNAFLFFESKDEPFITSTIQKVLCPQQSLGRLEENFITESFLHEWSQGTISISSFITTGIGNGPERMDSFVS